MVTKSITEDVLAHPDDEFTEKLFASIKTDAIRVLRMRGSKNLQYSEALEESVRKVVLLCQRFENKHFGLEIINFDNRKFKVDIYIGKKPDQILYSNVFQFDLTKED